jgi:hypothetical protein
VSLKDVSGMSGSNHCALRDTDHADTHPAVLRPGAGPGGLIACIYGLSIAFFIVKRGRGGRRKWGRGLLVFKLMKSLNGISW